MQLDVLAFHELVFTTRSVTARLAEFSAADVDALDAALRESVGAATNDLGPRAHRGTGDHRTAGTRAGGLTADDVHPQAFGDAGKAFTALRNGVADQGY